MNKAPFHSIPYSTRRLLPFCHLVFFPPLTESSGRKKRPQIGIAHVYPFKMLGKMEDGMEMLKTKGMGKMHSGGRIEIPSVYRDGLTTAVDGTGTEWTIPIGQIWVNTHNPNPHPITYCDLGFDFSTLRTLPSPFAIRTRRCNEYIHGAPSTAPAWGGAQ